MSDQKTPVELAAAKVGDLVVHRYNSDHKAGTEKWRLLAVTARTHKSIALGAHGKFMTTGMAYGLANRRCRLFNPTPDVLAKVAETAAEEAKRAAAAAAREAVRAAAITANAGRAAAWLVGKSAAELLAFLPDYALSDLWETIEPRLTETTDAVP